MLIVLLILGTATFVVTPLLLWAAARILRIKNVGIGRAYAAFGILLAIGLGATVLSVATHFPLVISLAIGLGLIVLQAWAVKAVFRSGWGRAIGCVLLAGIANVAVALGIRAVAVEAFYIPTGGMQPTLISGDRVLADKLTPQFQPPQRGEVVFFHPPHKPAENYVERVAAMEGDKLEVVGDELLVNGKSIGNCHMTEVRALPGMTPLKLPTVVPPGKLLLLGDNRSESLDSRYWGFAAVDQVFARAALIYASTPPPADPRRRRHTPTDETDQPEPFRWERVGKVVK